MQGKYRKTQGDTMISTETREKWKRKIDAIHEAIKQEKLETSEWEREFIASIFIATHQEKDLSFKQSSILGKIYARIL